jgi:hypothetical protein
LVKAFTDFAANTGPVNFGHHPIEECETRRVRPAETFNGLAPIGNGHDFVASTYERFLQQAAGQGVIVGN